jgi:hypothetical protein
VVPQGSGDARDQRRRAHRALYDLASAYQEVGDTENAQKAFMEVYGMNSNYRDIVTRIKALEDSRR